MSLISKLGEKFLDAPILFQMLKFFFTLFSIRYFFILISQFNVDIVYMKGRCQFKTILQREAAEITHIL